MENTLVNKVAQSGLVTINMEDWYPTDTIEELDLKDFLFHGLILKEKEFRDAIKNLEWEQYQGKVLCVFCSTDAIIPVWAFMLIAAAVSNYAIDIHWGTKKTYLQKYYKSLIDGLNVDAYANQRIVIKGCSKKEVPASAYMDITRKLKSVVQSIMYGEPCSTVPVFKRKKEISS